MTSPTSSDEPKSGDRRQIGKKSRSIFKPAATVAVALVAVAVGVHFTADDPRTDLADAFRTAVLPRLLRLGWRTGLISHLLLRWVDVPPGPPNPNTATKKTGFYSLRRAASASWYRTVLDNWSPDGDDAVVATFPKSGTHFAMQLAVQALAGGNRDYASIHHASTLIEFERISPDDCGGDPEILTILNYREVQRGRTDVPAGTVHATHLPIEMLLRGDGRDGANARYVIVMRNPLDVLHSLRNIFAKTMGPVAAPTHEEVYRNLFLRTGHGWAGYNLGWWDRHVADPDRVLFLFYEDAVANLTDTVVRLFDFLGVDSTDEDAVERVRYRSSMEYMKPRAEMFDPPPGCSLLIPGGEKERKKGVFVDVGKAGRGRENIPVGLRREVERYYHESFDGTSFPVERYAGTFV